MLVWKLKRETLHRIFLYRSPGPVSDSSGELVELSGSEEEADGYVIV
jgi:hypothetical protein